MEEETNEKEEESTTDAAKNSESDKSVLKEKYEEKVEEETKPQVKLFQPAPVKFYKLYRFAEIPDYILMTAGFLGSILSGLSAPANSYIFGDVTNAFLNYIPGDEEDFLDDVDSFALNNTLLGVAVLLTSYISIVIYSHAIRRQIFKIRLLYFKASLRQEISFYDIYGTGEFATRMSENLNKLEDGISEKVIQVVHSLSAFLGCVILSLAEGWELALISLAAVPLIVISIQGVSFLTKKFSKTELEAYAKAGSIAQEVLSSIKTVVAFSGQKKERQRYDNHLLLARNNNIKRGLFHGAVFGTLWFLVYVTYGIAFWFGVQFVFDEKYEVGQMTTVFFSVIIGTLNLFIIGPFIEVFSSARVAAGVVFWIIDRPSAIDPTSDEGSTPEITGSIEFRNVYFSYPTRPDIPVLKGISLRVNVGETVALVGPSGSGKSTCVQLIQRFYDPTHGQLLIDGQNISEINVNYLREHIGVVGQEPILFSATVKENILYAKEEATDAEITAACEKANARVFISKLPMGYDTIVGEKGSQLSGGQKQRIALARALIRNPRILLLDEATSALDIESESKVQKALDAAAAGRTTIIVAHRLSTIRNADKIVVLSKGEIVEEGTHEELYRKEGYYFHLVTSQMQRTEEERESSDENLERAARKPSRGSQTEDSMTTSKTEPVTETEAVKKVPLKEIMRLNAPEWKWLLAGTMASMFIGCCYPFFSLIFGDFMRIFDLPRDLALGHTKILCTAFVIIGAVMAVSTFLQTWTYTTAGEKLTMRLRSQTFTALLRQEMAWFDKKENAVGVLCSRLTYDTSNVQCATGQPLGAVVQAGSSILLAICFALFFQWKLGLITLCLGPMLIAGSYFMFRNLRGGATKLHRVLEKSTKIAVESIANIRTVAGLNREVALFEQYKKELRPARKMMITTAHSKGLGMGVARSLMFFSYAICMFYGGRLVAYEGEDYPSIFRVIQTLIITSFTVAQAFAFTSNFQKGLLSATKIYTLLTRQPKIKSPDMEVVNSNWTAEGDVTYDNVSFKYPTMPREPVLTNFNLEILKGRRIALVGHSGCGKSTVLQLLERFYDPDAGKVTLDDHDLKTLKLNHMRRQLGIVPQEPVLFDRTIEENIAYGDNERNIPIGEIIDAAEKANAHGFISSLPLGYNTPLGENGIRLSGGQKQRVAIARALIRKPKVLLLDEATSALDTQSEKMLQDAMDKSSMGRTCIMIAHRLSTVTEADRIVVLNQGAVAETGTHSELLSRKGIYKRLYSLQGK